MMMWRCDGHLNSITNLGLYTTRTFTISRCYINCHVELMCKHSITKVTKWKVKSLDYTPLQSSKGTLWYSILLGFFWGNSRCARWWEKNILSSLIVYKPKCTIILAQYDARFCGYSLGCCKQEGKYIFLTRLSNHASVNLSCHKSLPITFSQEHHKTSKYKDVNKRFVPFWF